MELIDKEILLHGLKLETVDFECCETDYDKAYLDGKISVIEAIQDMPIVDAVCVVRCKDCLHSYIDDDGYFICANSHSFVKPNGFCSSGRKEYISE